MYKALRNFRCNGVKKKHGQKIDKKEAEKMEGFIEKLVKDDVIISIADEKKSIAEADKVEKQKDEDFAKAREEKKAARKAAKERAEKEK